jgi:hypothetical protein
VRENQALRAEVQRLNLQGLRTTHRRGQTDDSYAVLHGGRDALLGAIIADYRVLSKRDHLDVAGWDAVMKQINMTRAAILQRNGRGK